MSKDGTVKVISEKEVRSGNRIFFDSGRRYLVHFNKLKGQSLYITSQVTNCQLVMIEGINSFMDKHRADKTDGAKELKTFLDKHIEKRFFFIHATRAWMAEELEKHFTIRYCVECPTNASKQFHICFKR